MIPTYEEVIAGARQAVLASRFIMATVETGASTAQQNAIPLLKTSAKSLQHAEASLAQATGCADGRSVPPLF